MKKTLILDAVAKTLVAVRLGGTKSDPKLARLDRGVLTVALLVAALDGMILPEEYAAFDALAKKCRGASAKNVRALFDMALPAAGHLITMAQIGTYSEKERLAAFVSAAAKVLPRGFADGTQADLRRGFALWIAMGLSDGIFGDLERKAVNALYVHFAEISLFRKKKVLCLERNFLEQAEKVLADFASPARRTKAEAALDALVSTEV